MTVITNAQLVAGRLISDTPDQGVIAGEKPDGSVQNLLVADATTGDVTLPTFAGDGAHRFGGDVVASGEIYVGGTTNIRDLPGGPHTHTFDELSVTPTTLAGYAIADAYTGAEIDGALATKADTVHTHAWGEVGKTGSSLADLQTRSAADLTSGTLHDDRVAQSNVTQHEAALTIGVGQITGTLPHTQGGTGLSAVGTAGQVLAVNAAASGTEWVDPSTGGGLAAAFASIANGAGVAQFSASGADALQFAAGSDLSVSFDPTSKRVTFSYTGGGASGIASAFATVAVGGTSGTASGADTLTFAAGTGLSAALNASTKTVTYELATPVAPAYGGTGLSTLGTAGQLLAVNATADGTEWVSAGTGGGLADAFASIADEAGATQFSASGATALRLAAVGGLGLAFDGALRKVTIGFIPKAPSGLTAQGSGATSIALAWVDTSDNETGFEIERSLDGATGWTAIHTTAAGATTHTDTGLTSGVTYHYRVRAVGPVGSSGYSGTASSEPAVTITDSYSYTRLPLTVTDTGHTYQRFGSDANRWGANGSAGYLSPAPADYTYWLVDAGYSNGSIEINHYAGSVGQYQLLGRSGYLAAISPTGIVLYSEGGNTQIGSWSGTINNADQIKLVCSGSTIQVHVAGVQRISVTNTTHTTNTTWGLRAAPGTNHTWDNLAIRPI